MKSITVILSLIFCAAAVSAEAAPEENVVPPYINTTMGDNDYDINKALADFAKGNAVKLWFKLLELMEQMKKDCPTIENDFEKEFQSVRECAKKINFHSNQTMCQAVRTHFHTCNKPVRDLLSNCMPPKSKDLPELISTIAVAIFDKACQSTVEQILASTAYGKLEKKPDDNEVQKIVTDFLEEKASDLSMLNDIIEMIDKTKKNCPDLDVKLNATMAEVQKCTEEIKIGPNTICTILKTNVIQCTQPVREIMTSCLPEESKGLPLVLERIFITIIRQACSSTVEEFLEFFNPCQFSKSVSNYPSCQEVTTVVQSFRNKLPSKEFVCSLLSKLRSCSKDIHNATCTNIITKTVFLNLHQALEDNTKDVCRTAKNELN